MEKHKSKNNKKYKVPTKFKPILIDLIKEILINQPKDIIDFSANYFKIKQEESQSLLNQTTTYTIPLNSTQSEDSKKKLNINKKKIVSQKSTCKKDWDKPADDNSQLINGEKTEETSLFECINFEEKEKILNKIKNSDSSLKSKAEHYLNKVFLPNKKYNDLLILAQKAIMSYYKNKGTDKENEFTKLNEEIESKAN